MFTSSKCLCVSQWYNLPFLPKKAWFRQRTHRRHGRDIIPVSLCCPHRVGWYPGNPKRTLVLHPGWLHVLFLTSTMSGSLCSAQREARSPSLPYAGCVLHPGWLHVLCITSTMSGSLCSAQREARSPSFPYTGRVLHPGWLHVFGI